MSDAGAAAPTTIVPGSIDDAAARAEAQERAAIKRIEVIIPGTKLTFGDTARLAKTLHASGLLSKKITSVEQAFAIIVAGAEMDLPPMLSLRAIAMVEGKPTLDAGVQLGLFKRAGGRAEFKELTIERAVLWLKHPNGDEHIEVWTREMAVAAGLMGKDNWKKHPLAMMRSRVITAGLKSVGFEGTACVYDPDEEIHGSLEDGTAEAFTHVESATGATAKLSALLAPGAAPVTTVAAPAPVEVAATPAVCADCGRADGTHDPDKSCYAD